MVRLSGTIGQYNLFDECTHDTTRSLWSSLVTMFASEDTWIEHKHARRRKLGVLCNCNSDKGKIRKLLFSQIRETLKKAYSRPEMEKKEKETPPVPQAYGAPKEEFVMQTERRHLLDEALGFVPEFHELILILHVATDVFLISNHRHLSKADTEKKEAIEAMSDYMTFLAAARPEMLPGLKVRILYNETREVLRKIWGSSSKHNGLACILRDMENKRHSSTSNLGSKSELHDEGSKGELHDKSFILSEGVIIAEVLLAVLDSRYSEKFIHQLLGLGEQYDDIWNNMDSKWRKRIIFLIQLSIPDLQDDKEQRPCEIGELLDLLLSSWVRLLINVSTRCRRDSHAKQLGRGCELTTIVWVLGEHGSIFGI